MNEAGVRIFVCVACRRRSGDAEDDSDAPGQRLLEALAAHIAYAGHTGVGVHGVECLAVCKRPCTLALRAAGKWTYLVGDLDAERDVNDIVAAAMAYARSDTGIVPWQERPATFRRGVVARVPPLAFGAAIAGDPGARPLEPQPETP